MGLKIVVFVWHVLRIILFLSLIGTVIFFITSIMGYDTWIEFAICAILSIILFLIGPVMHKWLKNELYEEMFMN